MTLLELDKVHAGYGGFEVLRGIDIAIAPGEIVAIIGPNGAGKSTVIKAIYSIAKTTKGRIRYHGKDITHLRTHELLAQGIGYVNQGRIVFGDLSVRENLEIGAQLIKDKELVEANLRAVLNRFPALRRKLKDQAYTLSGGQRQMLAIGRALMHDPELLLLDEPSLGLSPKLQKELFKIIASLREDGIAVLIVEQNAKKAIEMADRTYLLENGSVALTGGKEILKHKHIKEIYLGGHY